MPKSFKDVIIPFLYLSCSFFYIYLVPILSCARPPRFVLCSRVPRAILPLVVLCAPPPLARFSVSFVLFPSSFPSASFFFSAGLYPASSSSIVPDVIRLRAVYLRCPLSFFLSSFFLPAVLPIPKYAYSGIKWPIFLKKSPFPLHISFFCCTFAPAFPYRNDSQTTVKRRSSDSQSQRNLPVTPKTSPNLCIILYYIFIYNIP